MRHPTHNACLRASEPRPLHRRRQVALGVAAALIMAAQPVLSEPIVEWDDLEIHELYTTYIEASRPVELTIDAEARDIYGRLLAYVATDSVADVAHLMAAEGFARELAIAPNLATADRIAGAVSAARAAKLGLWGACVPSG